MAAGAPAPRNTARRSPIHYADTKGVPVLFVNVRTAKGLLIGTPKNELQARITDLMVELK